MDKEMKERKTKEKLRVIVKYVIYIFVGAVSGVVIAAIIDKANIGIFEDGILGIIICIVIFILGFMLQIILHESGHLVCGLLCGYEFVSFRIGSLTFVKENGKIVLKKFNIKGTAGQCLMMPPEGNGYDCPYVLYNLGGVLMNIIVSVLCIGGYLLLPTHKIVSAVLIIVAISGVFCFITNGIPMKVSGITNDGYNVLSINKDKTARYSFYTMLRVNGLLHRGMRMKDMPIEWFCIPEEADLNNHIISSIKILEGNYYHDRKEFDKAKECYENLLNKAPNLIKIYENEIKCDLLFYEIIGEARRYIIDELYTKELKKYITITDSYITRKRLMYAYALIIEKDIQKAEKILNEVNKVRKTYPAKAEVESEMEIIDIIKRKYYYNDRENLF